jgi:hypothetical protein
MQQEIKGATKRKMEQRDVEETKGKGDQKKGKWKADREATATGSPPPHAEVSAFLGKMAFPQSVEPKQPRQEASISSIPREVIQESSLSPDPDRATGSRGQIGSSRDIKTTPSEGQDELAEWRKQEWKKQTSWDTKWFDQEEERRSREKPGLRELKEKQEGAREERKEMERKDPKLREQRISEEKRRVEEVEKEARERQYREYKEKQEREHERMRKRDEEAMKWQEKMEMERRKGYRY